MDKFNETQEGLCIKGEVEQTDRQDGRRNIFSDYAILRITSRLYLRVRLHHQTKSFQYLLEKSSYGRVQQVLAMTEHQFKEIMKNGNYIEESKTNTPEGMDIELGGNLILSMCNNKFAIFKEYVLHHASNENRLIQTLALNMEQFNKLFKYNDFIHTICCVGCCDM